MAVPQTALMAHEATGSKIFVVSPRSGVTQLRPLLQLVDLGLVKHRSADLLLKRFDFAFQRQNRIVARIINNPRNFFGKTFIVIG